MNMSAQNLQVQASLSKVWGGKIPFKTGVLDDAITSGLEGAWTPNPTKWDHDYPKSAYWNMIGSRPKVLPGPISGGLRYRIGSETSSTRW